MRSFLTASCIILAVIVLITVNSVIVLQNIDDLLSICTEIGSGISDAPDRLFTAWQNSRRILAFSTHNSQLERAENAVYTVCESEGDPDARRSNLIILISVLRRIADSHRFSIDSIF